MEGTACRQCAATLTCAFIVSCWKPSACSLSCRYASCTHNGVIAHPDLIVMHDVIFSHSHRSGSVLQPQPNATHYQSCSIARLQPSTWAGFVSWLIWLQQS